jgi:anti-sigma B factor antagonist
MDQGSFQLSREDVDDRVSVVVLCGDADRFRTEAVAAAIEEARRDGRDVVVDLTGATYLDSSMLAALVAASEQTRRRSAPLVVVCDNERLRRSFELKGLEPILRLAETRDDALDLLASDRSLDGSAYG